MSIITAIHMKSVSRFRKLSRFLGAGLLLSLAATGSEALPIRPSFASLVAFAAPVPQSDGWPIRPFPVRMVQPAAATARPQTTEQRLYRARPPGHPATSPAAVQSHISVVKLGMVQLQLINADRASAGLSPVAWSPCLELVARQNAHRIAEQGFLSHTDGPSRDLGCGLGAAAGENIAYRSDGENDPLANTMFMNSSAHRANILGPYRYLGAAWETGPDGNSYIAVAFG